MIHPKFVRASIIVAIAAAPLCLSTARVQAMIVEYAADEDTALTLPGGTVGLPVGDLIEIGNFNGLSDAAIVALGSNATALQSAFHLFGTGHVGDSTSPTAAGSFIVVNNAPGAGFFGTQAYLIAFNAATVNQATGVIVAKGTSVANDWGDPWIFPSGDLTPAAVMDIASLGPANILIGTYFAGTFDDSAGANWFGAGANAIAMVPEPSSIALVGIAMFGALGLVRRRS